MLRPTVTNIKIMHNYHLELIFDNGEVRLFNVNPYITGDSYSELLETNYFSRVVINGYNIEWPNGQDICPDDLYYNSVPCDILV